MQNEYSEGKGRKYPELDDFRKQYTSSTPELEKEFSSLEDKYKDAPVGNTPKDPFSEQQAAPVGNTPVQPPPPVPGSQVQPPPPPRAQPREANKPSINTPDAPPVTPPENKAIIPGPEAAREEVSDDPGADKVPDPFGGV